MPGDCMQNAVEIIKDYRFIELKVTLSSLGVNLTELD